VATKKSGGKNCYKNENMIYEEGEETEKKIIPDPNYPINFSIF